jgi:hypothetical protein
MDGTVTLRDAESSVLVQSGPLDGFDADSRRVSVDTERRLTVELRFGGQPTETDAPDAPDIVVAPDVDPDTVDAAVAPVDSPADLTGYGMALTEVFDDADRPLLVRVDSLTALLQRTAVDEAFRFVHVLSGRVRREDAVLVAGIDADTHDEQTVAKLLQPFDVTVTDTDGRVRRR